jgi:peptidoglycan hydrolase-like protein with peptidoglycan-binding domain
MRLSNDQVTQLQTSLQQLGCDPGSIDGVMGSHTRSAMRCARQKNNITSSNPNALYQSLNLNFANSDTGAVGGTRSRGNRSSAGMRDSTGRHRVRSDSTRRPQATRPDSTRRP